MMLNAITEHLDLWSSAHTTKSGAGRGNSSKLDLHGIKKLRELILELAVRGKLVPQNPEDEPASVLLERIKTEKAQLISDKQIKRQKPLPPITEDEKPFELPSGWGWARLGEIGRDWGQKTPDENFTYLDVSAIDNTKGKVASPKVLSANAAPSRARKQVAKGTIIYSTVRPYLQNICVVDRVFTPKAIASTAFAILHPLQQMSGDFFALYLRSPIFVQYVESVQTGIAYPAINDKQFFSGITPVPPYAEAFHIVNKVSELMILCDQLEQQQTNNITAHQSLVETLLATLANSTSAQELAENWNRIAGHFDTLFTTDHSIDQLKQTILQLAVMGRLVPQNPNDEPASVLLDKIAAEKARLVDEKKIKKQKPFLAITDEEKPFDLDLPAGWEWGRLNDVTLHSEAGWSPKCEDTPREGKQWGVLKVSAVTWGEFQPDENKQLPDHLEPRPACEVKANDFLISRANTSELVARSVVVPEPAPSRLMMSDKIIRFSFSHLANSHYLSMVNNSPFSRAYYASAAGGTSGSMKNVSRKQIQMLVVALPPAEEAQRIVEKFDQLIALCDTLKSRIHQTQTTQLHLANAIVKEAVA